MSCSVWWSCTYIIWPLHQSGCCGRAESGRNGLSLAEPRSSSAAKSTTTTEPALYGIQPSLPPSVPRSAPPSAPLSSCCPSCCPSWARQISALDIVCWPVHECAASPATQSVAQLKPQTCASTRHHHQHLPWALPNQALLMLPLSTPGP